MAIASFVGSFLPAIVIGRCWNYSRFNDWHTFLIVLVNGGMAGLGFGIVCGIFCSVLSAALPNHSLQSWTDRALGLLGPWAFALGAFSGMLIAILTASRFHKAVIWRW